jgi:hypothetical protein
VLRTGLEAHPVPLPQVALVAVAITVDDVDEEAFATGAESLAADFGAAVDFRASPVRAGAEAPIAEALPRFSYSWKT